MTVLLAGANGFIGAHVMAALLEGGHDVVAAVRRPDVLARRFPQVRALHADFNVDTRPEAWLPRLHGVDAVINCAGVLDGGRGQDIEAIHVAAPKALFDACVMSGVRRVIHVSAVSADPQAGTEYARTKHEAETCLRRADLDWVIVRPSLVYASGSYGGTSVLRALAAFPCFVPVVGDGMQPFRPLHAHDLARGIVALLERPSVRRVTLEPAGPEIITLVPCWNGCGPGWGCVPRLSCTCRAPFPSPRRRPGPHCA
ncbi:MAG: NAD(P)H-binding protein [Burkholderiales bacterium]|nr:NAD(P)H-binding protein [Burkholderiales bacterium]